MSDEVLKQIAKDVAAIKSALAAGAAAFAAALGVQAAAPSGSGSKGGAVAGDADLDGQWGDPEVKRDPSEKYWAGQSYVGQRLSECPPDYLDALAKYKDASAAATERDGKAEKQKYVVWDRREAARARGWAARIRAGWKPKGPAAQQQVTDADYDADGFGDDGDIPF